MLRAIDTSNEADAIDILTRGLAKRPRAFWQTCLARLHQAGGNAEADIPVGHLLMDGSTAVGVILTPASVRIDTNGRRQRLVNMSSWYIEPEHRWRGPMMLRSLIRDPDTIYTDLTPTASVQKILVALGFKAINAGESIIALPRAAIGSGRGVRVVALDAVPEQGISAHTRRLLSQHVAYGCLALALEVEGRWYPLLFKPCERRQIPGVRLVGCESHALLKRWIAPVARNLLSRGKLFLIRDMEPGEEAGFGFARPGFALKYAKGGEFLDRTDFLGTELSLFDL